MTTVKDIMSKDVVWVRKDTSACEAGKIMLEHEITGMPVLEPDMTVSGVITEKDLLRVWLSGDDPVNLTVEHFMTHPPVWYREDESIERVYYCILLNPFRRVPVISSEGKLTGIVSRTDVLRYVLEHKHRGNSSLACGVPEGKSEGVTCPLSEKP